MDKNYEKECNLLKNELICNLQMLKKEDINKARKIVLEFMQEGLFITDLLHKDSDDIKIFKDYDNDKVQITKK